LSSISDLSSVSELSSLSDLSSSSSGGKTFQPHHFITKLPTIPPSQNGTGDQYQQERYFNTYGQLMWEKDPRGVYTVYQYDLATGGIVQRIDDADVSLLEGREMAAELASEFTEGTSLVTDFQLDSLGRTLKELGPRMRYNCTNAMLSPR
jgi:hypothetical protein